MAKGKGKKSGEGTTIVVQQKSDNHRSALKAMNQELYEGRSFSILEASIKDSFCNYRYEITGGTGKGFKHNVLGKDAGIVEEDMINAFAKLNIHLAIVDDVFKNADIEIEKIEDFSKHDLTLLYSVTGVKISGGEENESVQLIGSRCCLTISGSRMDLSGPKIPIDNLSSYKWYNELRDAIDTVRREVTLYHYGKYTPINPEEATDEKQTTMFFEEPENVEVKMIADTDFEEGKAE